MIPNKIHFIYLGGRPFSLIHYLAVLTAGKVNQPEQILLHYSELPQGRWWQLAQPLLTLNKVEPVAQIFGNPVRFLAHQADIIRLQMLRQYGGIYLDLDVICINPFTPLLNHSMVMGLEAGSGLCNAVLLAEVDAPFISQWQRQYHNFDANNWNYHSVILPGLLAQQHPQQIEVANQYAFFYPTHNDPTHAYLWGHQPKLWQCCQRQAKNLLRLAQRIVLQHHYTPAQLALYQGKQGWFGQAWQLNQLRKSYCLHLWEGLWGDYLKQVTPEYLLQCPGNFARLLREILGQDELQKLTAPRGALMHLTESEGVSDGYTRAGTVGTTL